MARRKKRKTNRQRLKFKEVISYCLLFAVIIQVLFILNILRKKQSSEARRQILNVQPVVAVNEPAASQPSTYNVQKLQPARNNSSAPIQAVAAVRASRPATSEKKTIKVAKLPVEIIPKIIKKPKGRIVIVLDDWGYSLNGLKTLKQIKQPITVAVLPNLPFSKTIAREAKKRGFEIIVHLPMEPQSRDSVDLEKNTITTDMSDAKIKAVVAGQLSQIPYIKGVNNHMGSKATEDPRVMRVVFDYLKKKRLYFLDSFVTADSVCSIIAREAKIGFAKRDIFLDNEEDADYINAQIDTLEEEAVKNGFAIGIGHDRKATLEVLKERLPKLQKNGFKFVTVSQVLRKD